MRWNRPKCDWRLAALALVGILAAGACAAAGVAGDDPFALANAARTPAPAAAEKNDPFAPGNAHESRPGDRTADTKAVGRPADTRAPATAAHIDFKVELSPARVRRGETVQLTITGTPGKGYH